MKTCLSIIDSYDEIMDFIFPPNLSFFMTNFELVLGRGGSRGCQTSYATNVKIANLIKVLNIPRIVQLFFYHAATPYNSPVSIIMQR
jgi:hypothetical protein